MNPKQLVFSLIILPLISIGMVINMIVQIPSSILVLINEYTDVIGLASHDTLMYANCLTPNHCILSIILSGNIF